MREKRKTLLSSFLSLHPPISPLSYSRDASPITKGKQGKYPSRQLEQSRFRPKNVDCDHLQSNQPIVSARLSVRWERMKQTDLDVQKNQNYGRRMKNYLNLSLRKKTKKRRIDSIERLSGTQVISWLHGYKRQRTEKLTLIPIVAPSSVSSIFVIDVVRDRLYEVCSCTQLR